jgi:hypothetical protein
MSAIGFRSLVLLAAAASLAWPAGTSTTYVDQLGAFSMPIPAGWTSDVTRVHGVGAYSGSAFITFYYIDNGPAHPTALEHLKNAVWPQLRSHRLLRTGPAHLGNVAGTSEIYSGMADQNGERIVRMVTVYVGIADVLMISYCPSVEWNK